jgi:hypothetical protein
VACQDGARTQPDRAEQQQEAAGLERDHEEGAKAHGHGRTVGRDGQPDTDEEPHEENVLEPVHRPAELLGFGVPASRSPSTSAPRSAFSPASSNSAAAHRGHHPVEQHQLTVAAVLQERQQGPAQQRQGQGPGNRP